MPYTKVVREQFGWNGNRLIHKPTGARFTLGSDFMNLGRIGCVLPNGDDFEKVEVLKMAKVLHDERATADLARFGTEI
jgi:hypothetical protein